MYTLYYICLIMFILGLGPMHFQFLQCKNGTKIEIVVSRGKENGFVDVLTEYMGAAAFVLHLCFELNWKCPRRLLFCALAANPFCFLLKYHFVADVFSYAKDFV